MINKIMIVVINTNNAVLPIFLWGRVKHFSKKKNIVIQYYKKYI